MTRTVNPLWLIVLLVVTIAVAGCGEDSETSNASETASTSSAPLPQRVSDSQQDLPPLSAAQAARRAQRIALVTARGSRVIEGAPGTPFTRTDFTVHEVLKGKLGPRFALQVIGGSIGGATVDSVVQKFAAGQRYILFLGADGPVGPTVVPQVVLTVESAAGGVFVSPKPTGIPLYAAGSSKAAKLSASRARLKDVLFSVRKYVKAHDG